MKYARRADGIPEAKSCSRCGETKPSDEFYRDDTKATCLSSRCKTCIAVKAKDWKESNPEKVQADRVRYREEHKEWLRDRHAKQRFETKASIVEKLGGCCKRCGFSDQRALQFDHIYGGGTEERKSNGFDWWSWIKKLDSMSLSELEEKIQILCANCNQIKKVEENEYGAGKKSRWQSGRNCTCVARDRSECGVHAHIGSGDA